MFLRLIIYYMLIYVKFFYNDYYYHHYYIVITYEIEFNSVNKYGMRKLWLTTVIHRTFIKVNACGEAILIGPGRS